MAFFVQCVGVPCDALMGTKIGRWTRASSFNRDNMITKVAIKREDAVTKEMMRRLADDKKMAKKEKVIRVRS